MTEERREKRKAYMKEYNRIYREKNRDRLKASKKAYREDNKDKMRIYREKNKDRLRAKGKEYYQRAEVKACRKIYMKEYHQNNRNIINAKRQEHYQNNKDRLRAKGKEYKKKNRDRLRAKENEWRKEYYRRPEVRLIVALRSRINFFLNGRKSALTLCLIGIADKADPIEFLWQYLEKQFEPGMTRENHGEWHIDHVKPCASFDLTDPQQQKACFHYSNLQPLWAAENSSKGAKDYEDWLNEKKVV